MDNTSKKNPKSNNKNNDTSEDKKEKDDSMTKPVEWGKLAKSIAYTFVELSVLFIIGSRVVFAGKIAQLNVCRIAPHPMTRNRLNSSQTHHKQI